MHSGDTQVSNLRNREIDTQAVLSLGGISELCGGQVILRMCSENDAHLGCVSFMTCSLVSPLLVFITQCPGFRRQNKLVLFPMESCCKEFPEVQTLVATEQMYLFSLRFTLR